MDRLGGMQNPHEVEQNVLLERIIKNAVRISTMVQLSGQSDLADVPG
jgi:hypothetical protein